MWNKGSFDIPMDNLDPGHRQLLVDLFEWTTRYRCSNRSFAALRRIFSKIGHEIPSKKSIRTSIRKASGVQFVREEVCINGDVSYAPPTMANIRVCPVCNEPRYKRKNGRDIPRRFIERASVASMVAAIAANRQLSLDIIATNGRTRAALLDPAHPIDDFATADVAKVLLADGHLREQDIVVSFDSDGSDLANKKKESAHVQVLHVLNASIDWRYKHSSFYPLKVCGPGKVTSKWAWTHVYGTIIELLEIERNGGVAVWHEGLQETIKVKVILAAEQGDTVEQAMQQGMVGAVGKYGCLICTATGWAKKGGKTYYPAHAAPTSAPPRERHDIPLITAPAGPPRKVAIRTAADVEKANQRLVLAPNKKMHDAIRTETGISGFSPFSLLPLHKLLFPWYVVSDPMHELYANEAKHLLELLAGTRPSAIQHLKILDDKALKLVEALLADSRPYLSEDVGQAIPDMTTKWASLKCAERRTFVESHLLLVLDAIEMPDEVRDLLVIFVKLARATSCHVVDRDSSAQVNLGSTAFVNLPSNGVRRTSLNTIDYLTRLYVEKKESVLYMRDPEFLSVCTFTTHRLLHRVEMIRRYGPTFVYGQWGLEGFIGDLKNASASKVRPAQEMANIAASYALVFACRLRYALLAKTLLDSPILSSLTSELGRNGRTSSCKEVERKVLAHDEDDGASECSDREGRDYFAEVLSFWSAPVGEQHHRLLARVAIFRSKKTYKGLYPLIDKAAEQETRMVDFEEIRLPVGLQRLASSAGKSERWAIVFSPRMKATERARMEPQTG
ncbi:hypothetical protein Rhopal_002188-T1 [Rhodotorula paludigena]|uniref:Uncharacterized protein n=1 Tax=Rhodotorula paludigena TaxID=86838 RepID=A0AAV5GJ30_9BASI|nr:hypothetical protein Rhopal_002188-T1 [Rhodotorula paludigena]